MNIIGEVAGKTCVLIDDLVDTAGTLCHAAKALKDAGAKKVRRVHHARGAVGPGDRAHREVGARRAGRDRHDSAARGRAKNCPKIRQLTVAGLLAETMRRIRDEESVSSLYID